MDNDLTRREHDGFHKEFAERMDAENTRQNKRLDLLEKNANHITDLTVSVEKIAVNMSNMLEELRNQGERLEALENEPVETYKQIRTTIIASLIGTVVGSVATAITMFF